MNTIPTNPNNSIIRLTLPVKHAATTIAEQLELAISLKDFAQKSGGQGRVFRLKEVVQIDIHGLSKMQIDEVVSAYADFCVRRGVDCQIPGS
jgi:hypothetical protein